MFFISGVVIICIVSVFGVHAAQRHRQRRLAAAWKRLHRRIQRLPAADQEMIINAIFTPK